MHSVGNKIKEYRMKNNMTQEGLAKLLMVSDKTISSYECDRTMPDINTLFKIANIFKTSIFSLIDDGIYDNKVELELKLKVDNDTYKKVLNRFNSTSSEKLEQIDELKGDISNLQDLGLIIKNGVVYDRWEEK